MNVGALLREELRKTRSNGRAASRLGPERARVLQELICLSQRWSCLEPGEDRTDMLQDGPGLGHPGQSDQAPAVAEERERPLRDNPEPLPAIGRISVGRGCCVLIATSLCERRVRRDEGVFGVWVRSLETGHEAFGEFGVIGFKGCAHHHREGYEVACPRGGPHARRARGQDCVGYRARLTSCDAAA